MPHSDCLSDNLFFVGENKRFYWILAWFWQRAGNSAKDNFAVWFFTLRFSLWGVQRIGNGILVKINKMICG